MALQFTGLPAADFLPLFDLSDSDLRAQGARRVVADDAGYPCRISLQRAAIGENLILLQYAHHTTQSPYRAAGPVYVREQAHDTGRYFDILPPMLQNSLLSLRAYDAEGMITGAEVVQAEAALSAIDGMLQQPGAAYLHVHFARPGCYACQVVRV